MMTNNHDDSGQISIITYKDEFASDFARINYEWLEAFFEIEPHDREQLENPFKTIIKPGGQILFALKGDQVVGTIGIALKDPTTTELIKMGVVPAYKGQGIGKQLVEAAIDYCRKSGVKKVLLETSDKLAPAMKIYERTGFKEVAPDPHTKFTRCNVWMELKLI